MHTFTCDAPYVANMYYYYMHAFGFIYKTHTHLYHKHAYKHYMYVCMYTMREVDR